MTPSGPGATLRAATEADLRAIRDLHAASWRAAYAPFLPRSAMAGLDAEMDCRWAHRPTGVLGLWTGSALIGFVRTARRDGWPYIDNLHVRPGSGRRGAGTILLAAAGRSVAASGAGGLWLTVIAANRTARLFYAARGGSEGAEIMERVLGHPVVARPVVWRCLRTLHRDLDPTKFANALDGAKAGP